VTEALKVLLDSTIHFIPLAFWLWGIIPAWDGWFAVIIFGYSIRVCVVNCHSLPCLRYAIKKERKNYTGVK
jgi:hypothetical protein